MTFEFAKNVSLGRQDTSSDRMMIKINSDNRDGFAVENDHKPEIRFVKVDKENHAKKLSGAVFEIWSAKESGEWTYEPDKLLGTYTTGAGGTFTATLDYGTYFWREVQAPSGYKVSDYDYHKFRVIKGLPQYQMTVENETVPYTPEEPKKPEIPEAPKEIEPENPEVPLIIETPEEMVPKEETVLTEVPKTGDDAIVPVWVLLMAISLLWISAAANLYLQRHNNVIYLTKFSSFAKDKRTKK